MSVRTVEKIDAGWSSEFRVVGNNWHFSPGFFTRDQVCPHPLSATSGSSETDGSPSIYSSYRSGPNPLSPDFISGSGIQRISILKMYEDRYQQQATTPSTTA